MANTRDAFLSKLPARTLYTIDRSNNRGYDDSVQCADLFVYLAEMDRARRRYCSEFPYISFQQNVFKEIVVPHLKGAKSFIDVGCGGGDKLALVKKCSRGRVKVYGVEHDPAMAVWASLFADKVFCQDALTLDYSDYDVIYAYWPINNPELMRKLACRILDQMKPKAKFVLVGFRVSDNLHKRAKEIISGYSY